MVAIFVFNFFGFIVDTSVCELQFHVVARIEIDGVGLI